jgi:Mrp family chromosome partitioning ATPase
VLQDLRKRADVVLVSVGPAGSIRARSLARLADAALIEVVEDESTFAGVRDAVDLLRENSGRIVGLVFVGHESAGRTAS